MMTVCDQVIFVDDDAALRAAHVQGLELAGLKVLPFGSAREALAAINAGFAGAIVSDVRMPGMDGIELFHQVRALDPDLPFILITGHGDVAMAVEALQDGAYDFVPKPFAMERLVTALRRALEKRSLVLDNRQLEAAASGGDEAGLVGASPIMERLRRTVAQVAEAEVDVLIQGETGTGKELMANALHRLSPRRGRPMVTVNCAALPDAVFETELFGQEPGPASPRRGVGRIERADRGTLFLDEVENLSPALQARLLRVVEKREIWPLGAAEPRYVDVRIVAASKADLGEAVRAGLFRADLYYRLNVVTLVAPPLRERREDVPLLFGRFLAEAADRFRRPVPALTEPVRRRLREHDWPGNVRELAHFAERVALGLPDLEAGEPTVEGEAERPSLASQMESHEARLIREVLDAHAGDARGAMSALQLPRKTFYDKLNRHGISIDAYRRKRPG